MSDLRELALFLRDTYACGVKTCAQILSNPAYVKRVISTKESFENPPVTKEGRALLDKVFKRQKA